MYQIQINRLEEVRMWLETLSDEQREAYLETAQEDACKAMLSDVRETLYVQERAEAWERDFDIVEQMVCQRLSIWKE